MLESTHQLSLHILEGPPNQQLKYHVAWNEGKSERIYIWTYKTVEASKVIILIGEKSTFTLEMVCWCNKHDYCAILGNTHDIPLKCF